MADRIDAGVRVPETQDPESQKGSQTPASLSDDQVNDLQALLAKVLHEEASSEYGVTLNTCLKDGRDLTAEERKDIKFYLEQRATVNAWSGQGSNLSSPMQKWYHLLQEELATFNTNCHTTMVAGAIAKGNVLSRKERASVWSFMSGEEKKAGEEGSDDLSIGDKLEFQFNLAFFDEDAPLAHTLTISEAANVRGITTSCLGEGRAMADRELSTMGQYYAKMAKKPVSACSEMMDYSFAHPSSFLPRIEVGSLKKPFRYRKMARVGVVTTQEKVTFLIGKDTYDGTLWPLIDQPPAGSETDGCFVGRLYFQVAVVDDDGSELQYTD